MTRGCRYSRRRPWRHRIGRKYGRKGQNLRRILILALVSAAGYFVSISVNRMDIHLIRQDEQCAAEWISPWEAAGDSQNAASSDTVYGIRICPEAMEIQFYSRSRSIRDH